MENDLTFWGLISQYKIVIPTLQRDYAQGRKDQSALRERFLKSLRENLDNDSGVKHLDFVYGNIKDREFIPLDGQQRLTTLWLIHVYVALMAIRFLNGNAIVKKRASEEIVNLLNNFTYKTRTSSVDFIKALQHHITTDIESFRKDNSQESLSEFIQRQTWFFQGWKQDPTVQSMLRMLSGGENKSKNTQNSQESKDCIEKVFYFGGNEESIKKEIRSLYNTLFSTQCPIKFYTLNLNDIEQSDDLYIKMNARGEQLSSFENFKADLVEYLQRKGKPNGFVTIGKEAYILKKWDVEWTDLFWATQREVLPLKNDDSIQNREKKDNVDDVFFVFLKRYLLNEYTAMWSNDDNRKKKYKNDSCVLYLQQYENSKYSTFDFFEDAFSKKEEDILSNVATVLDELCKIKSASNCGDINKMIQDEVPMLKDFCMLPTYQSATEEYSVINTRVRGITLQQRVVFYGICQFLIKNKDSTDDRYIERFKHWLRLIANLSFYSEIENLESFRLRINSVKSLTSNLDMTKDLYGDNNTNDNMDFKQKDFSSQWKQEKRKIEIINKAKKNQDFETDLKNIEGLWIFRGNIDCILDDRYSFITKDVYNKLYKMVGDRYSHPKENENMRAFITALIHHLDPNTLTEGNEILFNNEHGHIRQQLNGILKPALVKVLSDPKSIQCQAEEAYNNSATDWRGKLFEKNYNIWINSRSCKICRKDNHVYLYYGTRRRTYDTQLDV